MRGRLCFSKKIFFIFSILTGVTAITIILTFASSTLLSRSNATSSYAIYGGSVAAMNAYPYYVKIRTSRGTCGGTLIHHSFILTSAHCVHFITQSDEGGHLFVLFGVNAYSGDFNGQHAEVIFHSKDHPKIFIHEKYEDKPVHQYDENDIALINTELFLYAIPVPALPEATLDVTSMLFAMAGVGTKSITSNTPSKTLDEAQMKVTSIDTKKNLFKAESTTSKTQSGCAGDSGGPAVATIKGVPTLIGVIAGGYCNLSKTTAYVSVPAYRTWITGIIGSEPPYINTITASSVYPTQHPLSPICKTRSRDECGLYAGMCVWNSSKSICDVVN